MTQTILEAIQVLAGPVLIEDTAKHFNIDDQIPYEKAQTCSPKAENSFFMYLTRQKAPFLANQT